MNIHSYFPNYAWSYGHLHFIIVIKDCFYFPCSSWSHHLISLTLLRITAPPVLLISLIESQDSLLWTSSLMWPSCSKPKLTTIINNFTAIPIDLYRKRENYIFPQCPLIGLMKLRLLLNCRSTSTFLLNPYHNYNTMISPFSILSNSSWVQPVPLCIHEEGLYLKDYRPGTEIHLRWFDHKWSGETRCSLHLVVTCVSCDQEQTWPITKKKKKRMWCF